jgi:hypothetical protein
MNAMSKISRTEPPAVAETLCHVLTAAATGTSPDQDLLQDVDHYLRDDAEMWRIERGKKMIGQARSSEIDNILSANNARLRAIIEARAETTAGVRAKALALRAFTADPPGSSPFLGESDGCLDTALIASILRDLVQDQAQ